MLEVIPSCQVLMNIEEERVDAGRWRKFLSAISVFPLPYRIEELVWK